MSGSQRRAVDKYKTRLTERGLARFEVIGRDADRDLVRSIARRLAEGGLEADRLRAAAQPASEQKEEANDGDKGAIYRALRNSPLVGADLDFSRAREVGRKVDLG